MSAGPKRVPIDFLSKAVPAGATVEIAPAIPRGIIFRLTELFAFDYCAHQFDIVALRVGHKNLLPLLPVSAVALLGPPRDSGVELAGHVANMHEPIRLLVKNTTNLPQDFRAVGFGLYAQEDPLGAELRNDMGEKLCAHCHHSWRSHRLSNAACAECGGELANFCTSWHAHNKPESDDE